MEALRLLLLSALLAGIVALPRQESALDDWPLLRSVNGLTGRIRPADSRGFRDQNTRIVRGKEATEGQFPYQAAILADQRSFCGGSILSESWILTAAHCVRGFSIFEVTVGATNLKSSGNNGVSMTSRVSHYNPGFKAQALNVDVAVIKLPKELTYTDLIQPTKLPTRANATQDIVGEKVIISGWGFTSSSGPGRKIQSNLRWASQTVISNSNCAKRFGLSPDRFKDYLACGYNPDGEKTCGGDSGGPFVLEESGVQVGIHSFSTRVCTKQGSASAFMRTGSVLDWISTTTGIDLP